MTVPPPRRLAINRKSPAPVISQTRRVMTASESNAPARSQTAPGMERVRSEAREVAIIWSLTDSPTSSAGERPHFWSPRRKKEARWQTALKVLFAVQFAQRLYCPCVLRVKFQRLLVVLNRQVLVAVVHISFAETVIDIPRFGIQLDIQLKNPDRICELVLSHQAVSRGVNEALGNIASQ